MIKNIINKSRLNISSMIRHGSVAVSTLLIVSVLFGKENIMLAFPIALTSTVMGRQNFHVKTLSKALRIIFVDIAIVVAAHISSLNLILGIPVNFISIFLIMYTIVSPYDLTFYKPFLMLYVFTQYAAVPTSQLGNRIMAVILGIGIVILASIINKANGKSILGKSVKGALEVISSQLNNITNKNYDEKLQDKCSKMMRDLAYRIYITRYKSYLTTNLGMIQFRLFIAIENFNLSLKNLSCKFEEGNIDTNFIESIKNLVNGIIDYEEGRGNIPCINLDIINAINLKDDKEVSTTEKDMIENIETILSSIRELDDLGVDEINKIYDKWERTDIDNPLAMFKEYFSKDSIRFKFAIRMALTMTVALFLGKSLGYYKIIWAIITIMSIMQPYYEDTIEKAKDRILGNVLAIVLTGVLINFVNSDIFTIIVLIISLYLLYGFKEYYKISLFAGMASMCIASLQENINILIFYRIIYVIVGVGLVMLINKYIFPYRLKDGIDALIKKITRLKHNLIHSVKEFNNNNEMEHEIRDTVIHLTLLSQKLYLRNQQCSYPNVDKFIENNNRFIIVLTYNTLKNL